MKKLKFVEHQEPKNLLRLDLGAGKGLNTPAGFKPIDKCKWKGIQVVDLRKRWPWGNDSVDEVQSNYLIQYLSESEQVSFFNELYRVMKKGAKALILTPHWCATKAHGDPMIKSVIAEPFYSHLNKAWRDAQNFVDAWGFTCDFDHTLGYNLHPELNNRAREYQELAVKFWKDAIQDVGCTLTKR